MAIAEIVGVRRRINVELVLEDGLTLGDWVLIHVGFAMSKVSESEAQEQLRLLAMLGEEEDLSPDPSPVLGDHGDETRR